MIDWHLLTTMPKQLKVFSNKGSKDFEVKMPCYPFDIVYIREDNTLAVSSDSPCTITIINLETKQIMKSIALDSNIYGIALKDNKLIYSGNDKGIRMINLNDESICDIVREKMPSDCYTATFRDNIYHTNNQTDTVTWYNLHGKLLWTFHNESVLKSPRGIDVDNDVCLMAASFQSCGVCDLRHITKPSIVWCTECDEGLCAECQGHHSLSQASRSHSVIPIAAYEKLPADVLKITQYWLYKGIRMINLNDESISDLVREAMTSVSYTATFRDNIYHTNNQKNTVTCYNLQGKLQWTFHYESVLQTPHGIDVDNDGNVFVVGYISNNVVVISSDGKKT
ncbi:unnamed protein product [Mytilus edulis]|uniref:B box-type domain-containing protein n=1 Tax=Mytilus edulis TaxID=6550 RepID=A0A8S3S0C0_MYTED|nr:unnamed protein product [Mytilus edulis]